MARLVALLFGLLLTGGCQSVYSGAVVLGDRYDLLASEVLRGDLVVVSGRAMLIEGSRISGSVYVLGGQVEVDGAVDGDVSAIGGDLHLGSGARVAGSVNVAGQPVIAPGAAVDGGISIGSDLPDEVGAEVAARSTTNRLLWLVPQAALVGILAPLVVSVAGRPLRRVSRAVTRHWLVSAALGMLVALVGPALLIMMAFTIILIPLAVLLFLMMALSIVYGWIALGLGMTPWVARSLRRKLQPRLAAFLGTFAFMLMLGLLDLIPFVGGLVSLALSVVGLGAVALTRYGLVEFVPAPDVE